MQRKERSKRKKTEKQKVKMYITEYIFLKPKDQTNEHEQKNK